MTTLPVSIEEEMKVCYLDYAMSVIIGRALPDVRDGLKPVQRRILYAMFREGLTSDRKYSKCAGVVGEVLKKYHPHGDSAVYDALVRMAQDFNMRYPLVDGQGNFGSMDGDPAAAYRYTEARLDKIAEELLNDIDKNTVDYIPNFDEVTEEPLVLPAAVPNLLINGATGIAVGMATNIPPHNIGEIIDGLIYLIDHHDANVETLMQFIKGPDFPTGGLIFGRQGIIDAYNTGRGQIRVRARAVIEQKQKGGDSIILTEMPYQVNKARLLEKIAQLVREKKLEGISDLRDESDRDGIRVVIELKRDEVAQVVLNNLFKHTQMETTFGIIMLALSGGQPHVMGLKEILTHFLNHRTEVIIRRTRFELRKAEERAHILEGLRIALDHMDEIIKLIRASSTPAEAKTALMNRFDFSPIQAQAILDMRLQRLTALERDKINEEYNELIKEIERLKSILASDQLVSHIIKTELLELRSKYVDERRTDIISDIQEISVEDLITEEEMVITVSHNGYIKRNPLSEYRRQRRGGKGSVSMETREEDYVEQLFIGSTHHYILFFTTLGRLYWLKIYQIPEAGRTARGKAIVNLLQLGPNERLATALPIKSFEKGFLIMFTKKGIVKKTDITEFSHPRGKGVNAIVIDDDDELIAVRQTTGTADVIIGTKLGFAIRFNEEEVRPTGRVSRGVRGIKLKDSDEVVSAGVIEDRMTLLTVTEYGFGKRTKVDVYPTQNRGGMGVISLKVTDRGGDVVGLIQVHDEDEVMILTKAGKSIRTSVNCIPVIGRNTQGVRVMDVGEDENAIVSIGKVVERKQETTPACDDDIVHS